METVIDHQETNLVSRQRLTVTFLQWVVLAALFAAHYGPVVPGLVNEWVESRTYSYGFLVPFIAGYLLWQRWDHVKKLPVTPSLWAGGPLLMIVTLGLVGQAIGDDFSIRVSMILALASAIWLLLGREWLKALWFPVSYLFLMIPVPYVLVKDLIFHLRYSDATHAANVLQLIGVPVFRDAYFLHLPNMTLEVADVCSGVSSVFALFALGVIYAHYLPIRAILKFLLVIGTFPFAIIANLFRIILTAILAYHFGPVVLQSTFHGLSGTFTFLLALAMLVVSGEFLRSRYPARAPIEPAASQKSSAHLSSAKPGSRWVPYSLCVIVLGTGVYFSHTMTGGEKMSLGANLDSLVSSGAYRLMKTDVQDLYEDSNAETALSQVFVGPDNAPLELFVGYRGEQRAGSRLRSPKLHFPQNWNSVWLKPADLTIDRGTTIHGNWMLARKDSSVKLVVYWYQFGNNTFGGEFENRLQQVKRTFTDRRNDGAVVRIATPVREGEALEIAQDRLQKLAAHLYPQLLKLLPA